MPETIPPKIKALAPRVGGKRTLAPRIAELLGEHKQYFEPFVGGVSVLWAKQPSEFETVNDLHGELVNLAEVVQGDECFRLYTMLARVVIGDHVMNEAKRLRKEGVKHDDPVERAYWYFLESWIGRGGVAGTSRNRGAGYSLSVRWTATGGDPTTRYQSAVDSLPWWHERLKGVVILQRDAFEIIPKFQDADHTAIYVDPPYFAATRSGFNGSGARSRYEHDFEGEDHERLAEALNRFEHARVVLSYYDCPQARELYEGWEFHEVDSHKNLANQNQRGGRPKDRVTELLIVKN